MQRPSAWLLLLFASGVLGAPTTPWANEAEPGATTPAPVAGRSSDVGREVALHAIALVGVGYREGGESEESGFDCSGLVRRVMALATGARLPRTALEQSRAGIAVSREALQAGDLVFFDTPGSASSHVGVYVGGGRFVHAPGRGREVSLTALATPYWRRHYNGARRVVDTNEAPVASAPAIGAAGTPAATRAEHATFPIAPADLRGPTWGR